jgi:3-dehydroquinate dehydratase-2
MPGTELHRHSITSTVATSVICGLGPYGYIAGMLPAVQQLATLPSTIPASLNCFPAQSRP